MNTYNIKSENDELVAVLTTEINFCAPPPPKTTEPEEPIVPPTTLYEYGENAPAYLSPSGMNYPAENEAQKLFLNRQTGQFFSNQDNGRVSVDVADRKLYADDGNMPKEVASWKEGIFNFKPNYMYSNPSVDDVPMNSISAFKNTTTGEAALYFNDAGTLKRIIFQ